MPRPLSPLRARLVLLVLFSLLPAFLLLVYLATDSRRRALQDVQENAVNLVHLVASSQQENIDSARRLLFALSLLPEVRGNDPAGCVDRLGEILSAYPGYSGFGVADAGGNLVCATPGVAEIANAAGSGWLGRVIETKQFSLGDYQVSPGTGTPVLVYASPVYDLANPVQTLRAVVFAVAPAFSLRQAAPDIPLPEGTIILEIDSDGTVVDLYPDSGTFVGQTLPNTPVIQVMLTQGEGTGEAPGLDGVSRLFAFTRLHPTLDTGYFLAVGIPLQFVAAESDAPFVRSLFWLSAAGLLTLALAWWGSEAFILRWVRRLSAVTGRLSQGDLSARADLPRGSGELGELGQDFDQMAAALEQREADRRAAAAVLQRERERLKVTLTSIGDGVITTDARGIVDFVNGVAQALTGWTEADALGRPLDDVFKIVNEDTGAGVENPARRALREGVITGLANHTLLLTRDGQQIPIDDSAAPIRDDRNEVIGVVLVFRDVRDRRQAEAALRQSRNEVTAILQGVAEGITAQDRGGALRYANDAAAHILGHPTVESLLATPLAEVMRDFEIIDEEGRPFPVAQLPGRLALLGEPNASATIGYLNRATGEERWSRVKATPIFDAEGEVEQVVNIFEDITDLKRAEMSQRLLAEAGRLLAGSLDPMARLSAVVQLPVPRLADWCAVDVLDEAENIQRVAASHVDPALIEMARDMSRRYPEDLAQPRGVYNVLRTGESEFYPVIDAALLAAGARDAEHLRMLKSLGLRAAMIVPMKAHGRTLGALTFVRARPGRPYDQADLRLAEELARRAALALDNARLYAEAQRLNVELEHIVNKRTAQLQASNIHLQSEVAERKETQRRLEESQAQLRRLSGHLQAAREDERTRVAREIHDELGQALAGLKMDLAWVARAVENPDEALGDKLASMARLIDDTVAAVRRIATELRPRILDELGLPAAIEWQLNEFEARTGLACGLHSNVNDLTLDPQGATAIFRLLQETLTNVVRHAHASQVTVTLDQQDDHLTLRVQDNGTGIAEADIAKSRSFGLLGMKERVLLLDGEFTIHGEPGKGTTVSVRIPLKGRGA